MKRKPSGYWKDWNNLERELKEVINTEYRDEEGNVIKARGEFPTTTQLDRIEMGGLSNAIGKYPRRINGLREKIGFDSIRKPYGYWNDPRNTENEMRVVIDNEYKDEEGNVIKAKGAFPTHSQLDQIETIRSLRGGIQKYPGGINGLKEKMGVELGRKPNGYWNDPRNTENEMRVVIDNEYKDEEGNVIKAKGAFPTETQLDQIETIRSLNYGIRKYPGRINGLKKKMGIDSIRKPPGYWDDPNNIENEMRVVIDNEYKDEEGNVIKAKGAFPTETWLRKNDMGDLSYGIRKYPGRINGLKKKMGIDSIRKPPGYWDDPNNIEKEMRVVIDNEYKDEEGNVIKAKGAFPTHSQLDQIETIRSLINGIHKYPRGINGLKEKMGFPVNGAIKTAQQISQLIQTDDDAKYIIERFGGNEADVADILAVVYEGRIDRESALGLLQEPTVRDYLGDFIRRRVEGIPDIVEMGDRLLPHDKDEVIYSIILNKAMEYRDRFLGARPDRERIDAFLRELEMSMGIDA